MSLTNTYNLQPPITMPDLDNGIAVTHADSAAMFESVFKSHFGKLHAYACSIVKDDATAEEVVQVVFCKLWEKQDSLQIEQSVSAYLYRAVYNESINHLKHTKVKAGYRAYAIKAGGEETAADHTGLKELQQKIDEAINELPQQCRTIFQLSRFEELKYKSIASKLNLSEKTVETHMRKAIRILRTKLAEFLPIIWLLFINVKNFLQ